MGKLYGFSDVLRSIEMWHWEQKSQDRVKLTNNILEILYGKFVSEIAVWMKGFVMTYFSMVKHNYVQI